MPKYVAQECVPNIKNNMGVPAPNMIKIINHISPVVSAECIEPTRVGDGVPLCIVPNGNCVGTGAGDEVPLCIVLNGNLVGVVGDVVGAPWLVLPTANVRDLI